MRTATATARRQPWRTRRSLRSQAPSRIETRGTRSPRAHCVDERSAHASAPARHDAAAQPPAQRHVEVCGALQGIRRLTRSPRRGIVNAHPSGLHTSAPTRSWPIICATCGARRAARQAQAGAARFALSLETRRAHARLLRQRTRDEERRSGAGLAPSARRVAPAAGRSPNGSSRMSETASVTPLALRCGSPAAVVRRAASACAQSPSRRARAPAALPHRPLERCGHSPLPPPPRPP